MCILSITKKSGERAQWHQQGIKIDLSDVGILEPDQDLDAETNLVMLQLDACNSRGVSYLYHKTLNLFESSKRSKVNVDIKHV